MAGTQQRFMPGWRLCCQTQIAAWRVWCLFWLWRASLSERLHAASIRTLLCAPPLCPLQCSRWHWTVSARMIPAQGPSCLYQQALEKVGRHSALAWAGGVCWLQALPQEVRGLLAMDERLSRHCMGDAQPVMARPPRHRRGRPQTVRQLDTATWRKLVQRPLHFYPALSQGLNCHQERPCMLLQRKAIVFKTNKGGYSPAGKV